MRLIRRVVGWLLVAWGAIVLVGAVAEFILGDYYYGFINTAGGAALIWAGWMTLKGVRAVLIITRYISVGLLTVGVILALNAAAERKISISIGAAILAVIGAIGLVLLLRKK